MNAVPKNDYRHSDPQGTGIDAIPQCFLPRFRLQSSRGQIAESLEGNWRQELIFVLQQEIEMYDT